MCTDICMCVVFISCIFVLVLLMPRYTYIACLYWPFLCTGMYICIYVLNVLMPQSVCAYAPARQGIRGSLYNFWSVYIYRPHLLGVFYMMMLRGIVSYVIVTVLPEYMEVILADLVLDPVETHI